MAPHFDPELLDSARIAEVERIADPFGTAIARRMGFSVRGLMGVRGMAFGDTVALAPTAWMPVDGASFSVLFHELVHVAQYRELGVRRFLVAYVRGWLENGRDYFSIPLEEQAYALQERFDADRRTPIPVAAEVRRLTAPRASRSSR